MHRLLLALTMLPWVALAALPLERITLPEGLRITRVSDPLPSAQEMVWDAQGTLFVGSHSAPAGGKVRTAGSGLQLPAGLAYKDGDLYVSAVSQILRMRDIERRVREQSSLLRGIGAPDKQLLMMKNQKRRPPAAGKAAFFLM
ncbi:hypothetical protein NG726_04150 [Pseudomonas sp. MOB-449]|nr:hypothetical protein [Pseudomonas sp. MOB-449]